MGTAARERANGVRRPPLAAPHAVGTDVVDVTRFARLLALRGPALTDRVFTPLELAGCGGSTRRLAARFAAKEAVAKALGTGIATVGWRDVEIRTDRSGAPRLALRGRARAVARRRNLTGWAVSLGHDHRWAVAVVTATRGSRTRGVRRAAGAVGSRGALGAVGGPGAVGARRAVGTRGSRS